MRPRGWGKAWVIPPHDGAAGDKVFEQSYKSAILSHVADVCGLMCIHYDRPEGLRGLGNGIGAAQLEQRRVVTKCLNAVGFYSLAGA